VDDVWLWLFTNVMLMLCTEMKKITLMKKTCCDVHCSVFRIFSLNVGGKVVTQTAGRFQFGNAIGCYLCVCNVHAFSILGVLCLFTPSLLKSIGFHNRNLILNFLIWKYCLHVALQLAHQTETNWQKGITNHVKSWTVGP